MTGIKLNLRTVLHLASLASKLKESSHSKSLRIRKLTGIRQRSSWLKMFLGVAESKHEVTN